MTSEGKETRLDEGGGDSGAAQLLDVRGGHAGAYVHSSLRPHDQE